MLKDSLRRIASRAGYSIVPHDDIGECERLLCEMRPIETSKPLRRHGGDGDGGYLVPDDLIGIDALFSPGVSDNSSFESDIAELGIDCFLADASVDGPAIPHPRFNFIPKFVGIEDASDVTTLDSWVAQTRPGTSDLMLQMDIEGAEWGVLANASKSLLQRFRIIVIELHHVHRLFDCAFRRSVLRRLLATHSVVHNHPNNWGPIVTHGALEIPMILEVTFLRHDRVCRASPAVTFPHPLDRPNVPSSRDYPLPQCWYAKSA